MASRPAPPRTKLTEFIETPSGSERLDETKMDAWCERNEINPDELAIALRKAAVMSQLFAPEIINLVTAFGCTCFVYGLAYGKGVTLPGKLDD